MRITLATFVAAATALAQQQADPHFDASIAKPAYNTSGEHPLIRIDEAHHNFHKAGERYKPLADLLRNDGYRVEPSAKPFSAANLADARILIVANALGPGANAGSDASKPAFTAAECAALTEWVRNGGSLLLVSDHTPFGMAAQDLASAFGVKFGQGFAFSNAPREHLDSRVSMLIFSRENGLLGEHPITRGRAPGERIDRVIAFTGQSMSVPEGAAVLMKMGPDAREAPTRKALRESPGQAPAALPAQGLAFAFGQGRVVILGEAAMLSAQVVRQDGSETRMGMNVPGSDDRQFALNVLHWLSRLLN